MKKKVLSLTLAAALLAATFTGCNSSDSEPIPEGGWTLETLAEATTLCGVTLSYPLQLDSLGEDFEIDESSIEPNGAGSQADIKYKDSKVCTFIFSCSKEEISPSQVVERITFVPVDANRDSLSINGFTANDGLDELHKALGEPTRGEGTYVTADGGSLLVSMGRNGVFAIVLDFRQLQNAEEN